MGVENDGEVEGGISENIVQLTSNDTVWRTFLSYSLVASFKVPQVPYLGISTGLAWYQKAPLLHRELRCATSTTRYFDFSKLLYQPSQVDG